MELMTSAQARMARAVTGWSLDEAELATGVSRSTIYRFESGGAIRRDTRMKLQEAYASNGVRFMFKHGGSRIEGVAPLRVPMSRSEAGSLGGKQRKRTTTAAQRKEIGRLGGLAAQSLARNANNCTT